MTRLNEREEELCLCILCVGDILIKCEALRFSAVEAAFGKLEHPLLIY